MVARRGQNTELQIKQDKRKKFNNYISKKKQSVQIIGLGNMKMCVKLRRKMFSCINRHELILEILMRIGW